MPQPKAGAAAKRAGQAAKREQFLADAMRLEIAALRSGLLPALGRDGFCASPFSLVHAPTSTAHS